MPRYCITLSYDGRRYAGWQRQKELPSIQSTLEEHLAQGLRHFGHCTASDSGHCTASGRTDAGVHALGQEVHFDTQAECDHQELLLHCNQHLPDDIRILESRRVADAFHARYSASRKIYRYHLWLERSPDPFYRHYSHHVGPRVDLEALATAAQRCVGTHDFTSFANLRAPGVPPKNPIRTLYRCALQKEKRGVSLELEGNGFHYKMARNLVGALLCIAFHKEPPTFIDQLLAARNRTLAPAPAPPQGLFLVKVFYENA